MLGFAAKGGTTGGLNGPVVFINCVSDLYKHVRDTKPRILVITTNIVSPEKVTISMGANKTIIGSWNANIIENVYLKASKKAANIILQNLVFKHDVRNIKNEETQLIFQYGSHYWIDHCTFDGQESNEYDLGKLLKISDLVDYVTISNSKFMNHFYGLIFGHPNETSESIASFSNYPRVSIMFNYFDNIYVRAPGLMRYGLFHVYNNYITNYHLGFTIGLKAKIFSEKNYFSVPDINYAVLDDKGNGYFKDIESTNMPNEQKSKTTTWDPSSDYSYISREPEYSREFCTKYSGAQSKELVFGGGSYND